MILQCTKKLLDYLAIRPVKPTEKIDPLFEWSANLMLIHRRKVLVVTHVASRCAFVLYGITAKHLPKLSDHIREGIRSMMESEHIRPEIIDRYMKECGAEVTFMANGNRYATVACTKACERVAMVSDYLEPGDLLQKDLLPAINDDIVNKPGDSKGGGNHIFRLLIDLLAERYGEKVLYRRAVELEVSLRLNVPCTRTLVVPEDMNFFQLHRVLQGAFGWEDCHLHQFIIETDRRGRPTKVILPQWDEWEAEDVECIDSRDVKVGEILSAYREICYEYDFGDGWEHTIRFKRFIAEYTPMHPQCIRLEGEAPAENCGGSDGFDSLRAVLNDPSHPEYQSMRAWLSANQRKTTDLNGINFRIQGEDRWWKKRYIETSEE